MSRQIDALSAYSPMQICRVGAIFTLFMWSLHGNSSAWNFPIYLFGIVAHEMSGFAAWREFVHILFPSLFLDVFSLISPSGTIGFILSGISLGLKLALYFSSKRVLLEKGGEAMNGFESLDPRRAVQSFQQARAGAGGWAAGGGNGNAGGQTLGGAEQVNGNQTIFQMPGGLSSTPPPYANNNASASGPTGKFPGSGFTLGSDDDGNEQGHIPGPGNQTGRGGYQAVP